MVEIRKISEFTDILSKSEKIPIIIDFYADWCMPCRMLSPIIEKIEKKLDGKIKVLKVNVEEFPEISMKFEIMSIPTLVLIKGGKEIDRIVGLVSEEKILEWLKS
ncbi:MAG: thioredoxin, partial [Candidatus Aenigmatarchaeota archaeon]